jgi:hypothetical protein
MRLIILIILIIFLFIINKKKNKFEYFTNLPYIKNTDYIFIHIPKNGGTSFCKKYLNFQVGHHKASTYNKNILKKSLAIVRNPYSRLISCYKYFKMKNNFWYKINGVEPKYHKYCQTHSFNEFVSDLYNKKIDFDIHMTPQYKFLEKDGKILTKVIKLEKIEEDFFKIFKKKINMPNINTSNKINIKLSKQDKKMIYHIYKKDFELFNYSKDFF